MSVCPANEKKRVEVVSEGKGTTARKSPNSEKCCLCTKRVSVRISCGKCGSRNVYCSTECLNAHENHVKFCPWITNLMELNSEKLKQGKSLVNDNDRLPYKMKRDLIRLIGERPTMDFFLDGVRIK